MRTRSSLRVSTAVLACRGGWGVGVLDVQVQSTYRASLWRSQRLSSGMLTHQDEHARQQTCSLHARTLASLGGRGSTRPTCG